MCSHDFSHCASIHRPSFDEMIFGVVDQHIMHGCSHNHSSTHDRHCPFFKDYHAVRYSSIIGRNTMNWESMILKFSHAQIYYRLPLSHTMFNSRPGRNTCMPPGMWTAV